MFFHDFYLIKVFKGRDTILNKTRLRIKNKKQKTWKILGMVWWGLDLLSLSLSLNYFFPLGFSHLDTFTMLVKNGLSLGPH